MVDDRAVGTWLGDVNQPGIAVRTILPAAMCHADEPGGLAAMVTNSARYQAQQCTKMAVVVESLVPVQDGAGPYVRTCCRPST